MGNSLLADKRLAIKLAERYGHDMSGKWDNAAGGNPLLYCKNCWTYVMVSREYEYTRDSWYGFKYIIKSGSLTGSISGTAILKDFRLMSLNKHTRCYGAKIIANCKRSWTRKKNQITRLFKDGNLNSLIKLECGDYPDKINKA